MEKQIQELFAQALELEKREEFKAAIEKYKAILALDEKNVDAQFRVGEMYHQLGALTEALSAYILTTDLDKEHKKANVKIEMIQSILGYYNKDLYNP